MPVTDSVMLRAGDIVIAELPNSRQASAARGVTADCSKELTDDELADSIRRLGLLTRPRVRILADGSGRYGVIYGFRRVKACQAIDPSMEIECAVLSGSEDELDGLALVQNLSENIHRRRLQPWEIADALMAIRRERPDLTVSGLAGEVSLSVTYVSQLLKIRSQADERIWQMFKRHGVSLGVQRLVSLVDLEPDEQWARWQILMGDKQKPKKKPGSRAKQRGVRALRKRLDELTAREAADPFVRGVTHGIRYALGEID